MASGGKGNGVFNTSEFYIAGLSSVMIFMHNLLVTTINMLFSRRENECDFDVQSQENEKIHKYFGIHC